MKKKIMVLLTLCCMIFSAMPVYAMEYEGRVLDAAGLIDDDVEEELADTINDLIDEYDMDIVILTVNDYRKVDSSLDTYSSRAFCESYYWASGYGFDDERSGMLLMLSMAGGAGNRDWCMYIEGEANVAINDYGSEFITDRLVNQLADEDYEQAFTTYLADVEDFLEEYEKGTPYGNNHTVKTTGKIIQYFGIAIGISLVVAFIIITMMKKGMNTARPQLYAREYVKDGSFVLTNQQDLYLYSNTTKTAIPKSSSSGGGRSSGSRGGGGRSGKF